MQRFPQFTTPEAQARRDRIVSAPSWAAFAFNFVYLTGMRAWRHALAAVVAHVAGVGLAVAGSSLAPFAALLIGGCWILVGLAGRRVAWTSRQWRNLDDFLACQQTWDRWGKGLMALLFVTAAFVGSALLEKAEPRAGALFPLAVATFLGFGLRWIWRRLAPSDAFQSGAWRGLLIVGWLVGYLVLVVVIGVVLENLGLKSLSAPGALVVLWCAGTLSFVLQLINWSSRTKPSGSTIANSHLWNLQGLARLAAEALALPVRRPLTLFPFLIAVAAQQLIGRAIGIDAARPATPPDPTTANLLSTLKLLGLYFSLTFPILLFAGEMTSELVAQNELGRAMGVHASAARAASRLPAGLVATSLQFLGMFIGFGLLILPGLILLVRWVFVPHAVLLARDNALKAFRTSAQITAGHRWRIALLLAFIGLWGVGLRVVLLGIPSVGPFLISWIDFSWVTVATTLLYIRMGGAIYDATTDA